MPTEFELSIIDHAVASGRDANCFFQSFFHTLTSQSPQTLNAIQSQYANSIKAFVDTFNYQLGLERPIDFNKILEISRSLHPLERECVFGPILRHTYNTMIDRGLIAGDKLELHPDAILLSTQTVVFANAFGALLNVYMSEEQLNLSKNSGMPDDVAERVGTTRFEIGERAFYCDKPPSQMKAKNKMFDLNLVYADRHLNYTLGTRELNNALRKQVITQSLHTQDGIFAKSAAPGSQAPLAKDGLSFPDIAVSLSLRFALTKTKIASEFNTDLSLPRPCDSISQRSSTAFMAKEMHFMPTQIQNTSNHNEVENSQLESTNAHNKMGSADSQLETKSNTTPRSSRS